MQAHSTLCSTDNLNKFKLDFQHVTLLSYGIVSGDISIIKKFLDKICYIHINYYKDIKTAYTGDMGGFNYIVRIEFNNQLQHGFPCNTVFKVFTKERID